MSFETFNMSLEDHVETKDSLPCRDLQPARSSENHNNSSSDSSRSVCSPPYTDILDSSSSKAFLMDKSNNTTSAKDDVSHDVNIHLHQSVAAAASNGSVNFWSENLSTVMRNQKMELETCQSISRHAEAGGSGPVTSPDSAGRVRHTHSSETSHTDSTENDCCSLSSREIIRSSSFCLEDQPLPVFSSLEDSSICPAMGHPSFPPEGILLSTALSDVFAGLQEQKSTERLREKTDPPFLSQTFTQAEDWQLSAEENDMVASNSFVALPKENEGALLRTFVCEADCERGAQLESNSSAEAVPSPHFCGLFTPEQGATFVYAASDMQDAVKDVRTSTPVQIMSNHMLRPPSFSQSPFTENTSSPALNSAKQQQQNSLSTKQRLAAGPTPSASTVKKKEIKKFPRSDFSDVKCKVLTRSAHQLSTSGSASQHRLSQINMHSKHTQAHRKTPTNMGHSKVTNSNNDASTAAKMVSDARRGGYTGAACLGATLIQSSQHDFTAASESPNPGNGECKRQASLPDKLPSPSHRASSAQCRNNRSKTEQTGSSQAAAASAHQTFCFSPSNKTPERSSQTDPKQTPKKNASNKVAAGSGCALSRDKPPVFRIRVSCSSESPSVPPKQRNPASCSTSFTFRKIKDADNHLGLTKAGSLHCSEQNKQARLTEVTKEVAENSIRGVRKISLVDESSKPAGATCDERQRSFRERTSPKSAKGTTPSQPLAATSRPASLSARPRQGGSGRDECSSSKTTGTPQPQQPRRTASQRAQRKEEPSLKTPSVKGKIKPQVNGSRPPQTPCCPPPLRPPSTPTSRIPRRTQRPSISLEGMGSTQAAFNGKDRKHVWRPAPGVAAHRETRLKTAQLKAKLITPLRRNTQPTLNTTCKSSASTSQSSAHSVLSHLDRTPSPRPAHPTSGGAVDQKKSKVGSRQQHLHQQASQPNLSNGSPGLVPAEDYRAQQLREQLAASNCRFEALAVVLQQTLAEV
ncbi:hypothetical protein LDENG_00148200 [Lucifuga dentata]|nr:hypothetical protein LDENG_00148200 [Lucifuga dentata]